MARNDPFEADLHGLEPEKLVLLMRSLNERAMGLNEAGRTKWRPKRVLVPWKILSRNLSPPQRPLCIVGRLLCCGEAGEKEKESARGTLSIFFDYSYFDGDTQQEPLRRRESRNREPRSSQSL